MGNIIKDLVDEAIKKSASHSAECERLISTIGLTHALSYAENLGIRLPQCSLTAKSRNADILRAKASRMLSETKWWTKQLKNKAVQDFEHEQRCQGLVTNYISDELRVYHSANK
jgi:hypothetical protein